MYSGTYISQNLDNIGFNNLCLFSMIIKNRVLKLNCSMHLRSADWASIVRLSALINTIVLNKEPLFECIFAFAKNFSSSLINLIPLPCAQFTIIIFDFIRDLSFSYIMFKKLFTIVRLPLPDTPWNIICGILFVT